MKRFIVLTMVACLLLGGSMWAEAKAAEPIKIGAVFAVTGKASWLGEPERNTVKMIEAEVNAAGGINGRPIEIIVDFPTVEDSIAGIDVSDDGWECLSAWGGGA